MSHMIFGITMIKTRASDSIIWNHKIMPYYCSNDSAERESMKVGMHKRAVDSYERNTCLGANRIAYACSLTLFYCKSSSSSSFLFFRSLFLLFSLTIIIIFSPLQKRMMKKIRFHFILSLLCSSFLFFPLYISVGKLWTISRKSTIITSRVPEPSSRCFDSCIKKFVWFPRWSILRMEREDSFARVVLLSMRRKMH